jgi:hypothetical protein
MSDGVDICPPNPPLPKIWRIAYTSNGNDMPPFSKSYDFEQIDKKLRKQMSEAEQRDYLDALENLNKEFPGISR